MDGWNYIRKKIDKKLKINEPCWFYNTTGCKNKDGSDKCDDECKYLHIRVANVKKPVHINQKPCNKYNVDGFCKWNTKCLYSHRDLETAEWISQFPNVPHIVKASISIHKVVSELADKVKMLETPDISHLKDRVKLLENEALGYGLEIDMLRSQLSKLEWTIKKK